MENSRYNLLEELYRSRSCIFFAIDDPDKSFHIFADGCAKFQVHDLAEALCLLPTESRLSLRACVDRCRADRLIGGLEFSFDDANGSQRWFLARFFPTEAGKLHCIFLDISALKAREDRNAFILGEFAHRIKNNMSMVQAIARLTLKATYPDDRAFATFQARLVALANAQNLLIRNDWQGAFISDVVLEAIKPFDRDRSPFHVSGDAVFIPSRLAKAMMFALHELSTNAVKYGALSADLGEVVISWRLTQGEAERALLFHWQERQGPAIREAPSHRGFGSRMIKQWLAQECGGEATLAYREEGLAFELRAPASSFEEPVAAANILNDKTFEPDI